MKWSRSKPEVELQYGGFSFFPNISSYNLSRELRYVDEIWFADRFWPYEDSDINEEETEVVLSRRGRHLVNSILRHISASGGPIWITFGSFKQNTGSRIPIWRPFVFRKRKQSQPSIESCRPSLSSG